MRRRFDHPASVVAVAIHPDVVSVIKRGIEPMFDERSNSLLAEFIAERFRIISFVSGEASQVAAVPAGDLRADLRIVFFRCGTVNIRDV
jgi:hypothetical protein